MATLTRASFQTAYNIQSRSLHALQTARLFRRCFDSSKSSRIRSRKQSEMCGLRGAFISLAA